MTITSRDQLIASMGNNSSRLVLDKASLANTAVGQYHSLWRATGQPGQGAIPAAAASCNNATLGGMGFTQQVSPATSYCGYFDAVCSNSATTLEVHDRMAHMGGLNGTLATLQAVNLDLSTLGGTDNITARKGDDNFSDAQWWLEWYTDTGGTAVTSTVAVSYNDGTTGNLTGVSLAATRRASFMLPLNNLVPAAASGKFIRGVTGVTLSATTGAAGSFGVTATRKRFALSLPLANFMPDPSNWADLGLPEIFNSSCLFPVVLCSTTSTGTLRGGGKIIHG